MNLLKVACVPRRRHRRGGNIRELRKFELLAKHLGPRWVHHCVLNGRVVLVAKYDTADLALPHAQAQRARHITRRRFDGAHAVAIRRIYGRRRARPEGAPALLYLRSPAYRCEGTTEGGRRAVHLFHAICNGVIAILRLGVNARAEIELGEHADHAFVSLV